MTFIDIKLTEVERVFQSVSATLYDLVTEIRPIIFTLIAHCGKSFNDFRHSESLVSSRVLIGCLSVGRVLDVAGMLSPSSYLSSYLLSPLIFPERSGESEREPRRPTGLLVSRATSGLPVSWRARASARPN